MTLPRTTADVLTDHVVFEIESIDRMCLNVYQPKLQYGGGVSAFFAGHREGVPVADPGHAAGQLLLLLLRG
jgi:hypothetical protein